MIDLSVNRENLDRNIKKARENHVVIPTYQQMKHPDTIPGKVRDALKDVGLWDVNPLNLFRVTWKNEAKETGGLFQAVPNYVELPPSLTGVPCRIVAMVGKWFPTGCHKVGASFGCLVPRLVTGQFDATYHRAVWPSTGNYCRGGAFNSKLLGVKSVAILPQGMSRERFDWLKTIAGEIIATPGCESNVKEIFDKTHELSQEPDCMIFNQFAEMGNHLWHYQVTGDAIATLFEAVKRPGDSLAGACFTSGSAGTIGCGDYLKERYPGMKLGVGEALQCPTILNNGFGDHRIEGIGDKHIPWIHNVKNTDMVIAMTRTPSVCSASSTIPRASDTSRRRPGWTTRPLKSSRGWASAASPTSSAASRWPSTTSSPPGTWWPPSSPTRPACTAPASRSWRTSTAPIRIRPPPWTTAFICWACAPTPWRS